MINLSHRLTFIEWSEMELLVILVLLSYWSICFSLTNQKWLQGLSSSSRFTYLPLVSFFCLPLTLIFTDLSLSPFPFSFVFFLSLYFEFDFRLFLKSCDLLHLRLRVFWHLTISLGLIHIKFWFFCFSSIWVFIHLTISLWFIYHKALIFLPIFHLGLSAIK